MARWIMTCSLSGQFVEFDATYYHSDELGGELTSLMTGVNTHFLVGDVLLDLPGRDDIRDFLALDGAVYRVYESNGTDTLVTNQSASSSLSSATQVGSDVHYSLSTPVTGGPMYVKLTDPQGGNMVLSYVVRSDGKQIKPDNAWLSKSRVGDNPWDYFINFFDVNTTDAYAVVYETLGSTPMPPVMQFIPDRSGEEEQQISFIVEASDPNGTVPALSATPLPLPAGASFVDQGNGIGIFDWVPTQDQAGVYNITFKASDGALEASRTAAITICPVADSDCDGMLDAWEMFHFNTLDRDGTGDFDGDGIFDLDEFLDEMDAELYCTSPYDYTQDASNPLFTFDSDWFNSFIMNDAGTYKMWYAGVNGSQYEIKYATSPDGLNWSTGGTAVPNGSLAGVRPSCVIKDTAEADPGKLYKMWLTGDDGDGYSGRSIAIWYTTSPDGVNWGPLLNVMAPREGTNYYDSAYVSDPSVVKESGIYKMWYKAVSGPAGIGQLADSHDIGYATSPDGEVWTRLDDPVLYGGNVGDWNARLGIPSVIRINSKYYMYYEADSDAPDYKAQIGLAESIDGVTWQMFSTDPVLTYGDIGVWNAHSSGVPNAMYLNGDVCLFFHGKGTGSDPYKLGLARSSVCVIDNDSDGFSPFTDCDDNDAAIHPVATELCNSKDDDCNGEVDDVLITYWVDGDTDGYGDPEYPVDLVDCSTPVGYSDNSDDCDDECAECFPGNPEVFDGLDNNCDGQVDEGVAVAVPDVASLTQAGAEALIASTGLITGTVSTASSDTVPAGDVISQNPLVGAIVAPGSAVDIVVSTGSADLDGDGIPDGIDNCPSTANADQADADGDNIGDVCDNATLVSNPDQRDTNGDGYGNICDPDLNNDGWVNFGDLAAMKSVFGSSNADADLNGDGFVNFGDLAILKSYFGKSPGPSGVAP